ncbi:MAG: N-6 DNA methylase [Rhizobiaceae bacterium]
MRKNDGNQSDLPNGVIWRNWVHFLPNPPEGVQLALDRIETSPKTKRAKCRYVLTTDGTEIAARDLKTGETLFCDFTELADKFGFFLPISGFDRYTAADENPVDIKATGKLEKFYDAIKRENPDWATQERHHELNQFITRVIFCLFAEDTGIFPDNLFSQTLTNYGGANGGSAQFVLQTTFETMNLNGKARAGKPDWARAFPYVNGGLFAGARDAPKLSRQAFRYLVDAGDLDWKDINPDIFGSMIQSIVDDEMRADLGMHYTSVPNILKLLEPLFLDSLKADLQKAWKHPKRLQALLDRISRIRVFDPACGSGNFLVIAYRELRTLEIAVLTRLGELSGNASKAMFSVVDLANFYGIEYADFAAETAKLSLWIAEYQMNRQFEDAFHQAPPALPLRDGGHITAGNALTVSWMEACPPIEAGETYLVGNPPYLGSTWQSAEQKADMKAVFGDYIKGWKSLDYVAAWFLKGAEYIQGRNAQAAFVTTNSVVQGQQVPLLWPLVFVMGVEIGFAYTSFKWANLASHKAGVTVAIIGLRNGMDAPKYLFAGGFKTEVKQINAYLLDADRVIIQSSYKPLFDMPQMEWGNKPTDGGNLILSPAEKTDLIEDFPLAARFVFRLYGSQEFIRGKERYCLWIEDNELLDAKKIPEIKKRINAVREMRLASKAAETRPAAEYPHRFRQIQNTAQETTIIVPAISSGAREYLPVGQVSDRSIIQNKAFAIYDGPMWTIALIASKMHWVWIGTVCVRMRTDFSYSNTMGWNTFPVPELSDDDKAALTRSAENILLTRDRHFPDTIAKLYDPKKMPDDLRAAHRENDAMLESLYRAKPFKTDAERLEHLFNRYTARISEDRNNG